MRKSTSTLTPAQVSRFAVDFCQPHLQFRAVGKVTGEVILSVLFAAAARISSIHATCRRLDKAPCEETFTSALSPQLHDLNALKRRINAAFADHLPRALRRRRQPGIAGNWVTSTQVLGCSHPWCCQRHWDPAARALQTHCVGRATNAMRRHACRCVPAHRQGQHWSVPLGTTGVAGVVLWRQSHYFVPPTGCTVTVAHGLMVSA